MLTCEVFAARANEAFELALGESSVGLTLVEVRPLPVQPFPGMARAPFALLFRSDTPVVLPQKLYRLKNPAMTVVELFLVPVARDRHGVVYQAVFN